MINENKKLDYVQPDLNRLGKGVSGLEAIRQRIHIILTTIKGSDPLRPDFGCDAWKYIDSPVSIARPGIAYEVYDAILKWEPDITLEKVETEINKDSNMIVIITWSFNGISETNKEVFYERQ